LLSFSLSETSCIQPSTKCMSPFEVGL
jgi:hypothetical protein